MKLVRICFFAFCATWATGATAGLISWESILTGDQEVPPSGAPGLGVGLGTYDTSTFEWTWSVAAIGLTGAPVVGAHLHNAPPGSNGPIEFSLGAFTETLVPFAIYSYAGSFMGPDLLADLLAGNLYLNIHTSANPGGEIRGLVHAVSEPGTLGLLGAGLLGLGFARRRKTA